MKGRVAGSVQVGGFDLGHLEATVMEILWARGKSSVQDVIPLLNRPLAYTTVMTTLDRLYKKGFLAREQLIRAFVYAPRFSRLDWEHRKASQVMAGILAGSRHSSELLISHFLEAAGPQDQLLLEELENKIALKRKELQRRGKP